MLRKMLRARCQHSGESHRDTHERQMRLVVLVGAKKEEVVRVVEEVGPREPSFLVQVVPHCA